MIEKAVFGLAFVVALGSSGAMLFARNAVHVALFLVAAQIALALAFLLQGAYFIAAIQIILYAGAIMVLFLFVIMLLGVDRREILAEPLPGQRPFAIGLGALLAGEIIFVAWRGLDAAAVPGGENLLEQINRDPGNVTALARLLFGRYLLAFELTSVLLVAAIVGVMVLARRIGGDEFLGPTTATADRTVLGRAGGLPIEEADQGTSSSVATGSSAVAE